MTRIRSSVVGVILVFFAVLGSIAFAAQDRYTLNLGVSSFADAEAATPGRTSVVSFRSKSF